MGFAEVKEKADIIQKAVEESGILIAKGGSVPGLNVSGGLEGMGTYAKSLQTLGESLKSSIFKVLFMGTFKNGKSTTINALLGRELMPVGATEKTAVIGQVIYGTDDGLIRIFKNGSPTPEVTVYKTFLEQYQLTRKDKRLVEDEGGSIDDRFSSIDYVLLKNSSELLKNGVQLIDSPGLGATRSREKVTRTFFPQANAIIFLLDAQHMFNADERNFVAQHFVNAEPKPRNVFFLVNRINQCNSEADRADVMEDAKIRLKDVFTTNKGFNAALADKRLFFVDSYGMYEEKSFGKTSNEFGVQEFKRFEKELEAFLTSDDRALARYQSAAANLAAVYLEAQKQIEQRSQLMKKPVEVLKKNHLESAKKLKELEKSIERMEDTIDTAEKLISEKIIGNLQEFLGRDILEKWPSHAETFDKNISIWDMITLANPLTSKKRKQAVFQPLISFVEEFTEQQLLDWAENTPTLIQQDLDDLKNKLDAQSVEFSIDLLEARKIFADSENRSLTDTLDPGKANPIQLALSMIQGDLSVAIENASGGNFTW